MFSLRISDIHATVHHLKVEIADTDEQLALQLPTETYNKLKAFVAQAYKIEWDRSRTSQITKYEKLNSKRAEQDRQKPACSEPIVTVEAPDINRIKDR